jgi:hypothetical protein
MTHLTPRCDYCGQALETFEGHSYCVDCERYTVTSPAIYRDDGQLYRPVAMVPWSELTEGTRYALPGCHAVRVRTARPDTPGHALAHRLVILLEPVPDDLDRIILLEDDPF